MGSGGGERERRWRALRGVHVPVFIHTVSASEPSASSLAARTPCRPSKASAGCSASRAEAGAALFFQKRRHGATGASKTAIIPARTQDSAGADGGPSSR